MRTSTSGAPADPDRAPANAVLLLDRDHVAPARSCARISTFSMASEPRRPVGMSSTLVRGSSAVVTTTRPPGVGYGGKRSLGCRTRASSSPVPGGGVRAADAPSGSDLAGPANAVTGVEEGCVVEGEWSEKHDVLLSALGVALHAVAAGLAGRARVERVRDRPDEPGVRGDAFLGGCGLDRGLEDSGSRSEMRPERSSPTASGVESAPSSVTTTSSGSRPASLTSMRAVPSWPESSSAASPRRSSRRRWSVEPRASLRRRAASAVASSPRLAVVARSCWIASMWLSSCIVTSL